MAKEQPKRTRRTTAQMIADQKKYLEQLIAKEAAEKEAGFRKAKDREAKLTKVLSDTQAELDQLYIDYPELEEVSE